MLSKLNPFKAAGDAYKANREAKVKVKEADAKVEIAKAEGKETVELSILDWQKMKISQLKETYIDDATQIVTWLIPFGLFILGAVLLAIGYPQLFDAMKLLFTTMSEVLTGFFGAIVFAVVTSAVGVQVSKKWGR